ncbi:MAG: putative transport system ATP-binding protein [Patescibacteria group bacterium]|nr:putative transport system ATP-binding protein [Patescibacteria group bacterium]
MANILVKATNIEQEFTVGDEVIKPLQKVSFELTENSFNIIYGPSGSGKSTLLNVLTGLQRPTKGQVLFEGKDVYALKPDELAHFRANRIGIVYQTNYWVKSLSVIENVSMPLYFLGYNKSQAAKIAMTALDRVSMGQYAKKYPSLLSGGEQQRIATARALVNDPLFIIADEPTGSLDSKNGDMIMNLLRECQTQFKRTIILVTHNMEYLPLADHLIHIEDGQIQEMRDGSITKTAEELLDNMKQRLNNLSRSKHLEHKKTEEMMDAVRKDQ